MTTLDMTWTGDPRVAKWVGECITACSGIKDPVFTIEQTKRELREAIAFAEGLGRPDLSISLGITLKRIEGTLVTLNKAPLT